MDIKLIENQLQSLGVLLTEDSITNILESLPPNPKIEQIKEFILDSNFYTLGTKEILDPTSNLKNEYRKSPVMLQVVSVRNVCQPELYQESLPKLLAVILTDGHSSCKSIESYPITNLSVQTPPGTKVILNNPKISSGIFLLDDNSCRVMGGNVEILIEEWKVSGIKKFIKNENKLSGDSPPPFKPLLVKEDSSLHENKGNNKKIIVEQKVSSQIEGKNENIHKDKKPNRNSVREAEQKIVKEFDTSKIENSESLSSSNYKTEENSKAKTENIQKRNEENSKAKTENIQKRNEENSKAKTENIQKRNEESLNTKAKTENIQNRNEEKLNTKSKTENNQKKTEYIQKKSNSNSSKSNFIKKEAKIKTAEIYIPKSQINQKQTEKEIETEISKNEEQKFKKNVVYRAKQPQNTLESQQQIHNNNSNDTQEIQNKSINSKQPIGYSQLGFPIFDSIPTGEALYGHFLCKAVVFQMSLVQNATTKKYTLQFQLVDESGNQLMCLAAFQLFSLLMNVSTETLEHMIYTEQGVAYIQQQAYILYQYYTGRSATLELEISSGLAMLLSFTVDVQPQNIFNQT